MESLLVIATSIIVLCMSYGIVTPNIGVVIIMAGATLVTSTMHINMMSKDEFISYIDEDIGIYGKFMTIGSVIGPIRMFLAICIFMTLITFNLFSWQIYLASYFYIALLVYNKKKQLGLDL